VQFKHLRFDHTTLDSSIILLVLQPIICSMRVSVEVTENRNSAELPEQQLRAAGIALEDVLEYNTVPGYRRRPSCR